jgi:hypothetical protein
MIAWPFTARRPIHRPLRIQSHWHVGALVFMELHTRLHGNQFGLVPKPLRDDAFSAAGYCLDAHDALPAGSMLYEEAAQGEGSPMPTTIER